MPVQVQSGKAAEPGIAVVLSAAALALHPQQPAFGSHYARRARFHQASPVSFLVLSRSPTRFARRRTRQQALPRVPACECEIRRSQSGFSAKASGWSRPNNSLKPSPLRGLVAVWQACTPRRGRYAPRLSSGVRRLSASRHPSSSGEFALSTLGRRRSGCNR